MRWLAFLALAIFISAAPVSAQTDPAKPSHAQTSLPTPKAEPENAGAYAQPAPREKEGPSDADVGPVQKNFVRASTTDDLAETQDDDNASQQLSQEKIALDKRISIHKIHDVQNDSESIGEDTKRENPALSYEIQYLDWGAVTKEQLAARRGHYFTNTWVNDGPPADFTARFEYRQVNSKEIVRTLTQKMPHVSGTTRSYFAVVDKAYLAYGPVCSWRFTILKGDTVVAEAKSFIW
jgi:hypothetical protein